MDEKYKIKLDETKSLLYVNGKKVPPNNIVYYEIYKDLSNGVKQFISAVSNDAIAKDVCERYGFKYDVHYVNMEK